MSQAHRFNLSLFGGFRLVAPDGSLITIAGLKNQALIALLALCPNMSASREKLIGLLWSDSGSHHARNNLRQVIFGLRRDLASHPCLLIAKGEQLRLEETRLTVDYLTVTKAIASDNEEEWHRGASLYSALFLEGLTLADNGFEDWVRDTRELAFNLAVELHERLMLRETGFARIRRARELVALDPLRDKSQRLLIEALLQSGEIDSARKQYQSYAQLLKAELDTVPPDELTKLLSAFDRRKPADLTLPRSVNAPSTLRPSSQSNETLFSVEILPFNCRDTSSAIGHLAEGIAEDLSTELSRHPRVAVISRKSLGRNGSKAFAPRGPDFVMEGCIRRQGEFVRVFARLVDCVTGVNVWSERYERFVGEGFAIQDDIVAAIVSGLSLNFSEIALFVRRRDPTKCSRADMLLLESSSMWWQCYRESAVQNCLEQVIVDEPHNPYAHSLLSILFSYSAFNNSIELDDWEVRQRAADSMAKAISTGSHDPDVLANIATTHMLNGNLHEAEVYAEATIKLMPYDLNMLHTLGVTKTFQGHHEEGLALIKRSMGVEPAKASLGCKMGLTDAFYMAGDYASAIRVHDTILIMPDYVRLLRAASLAQMGRVAEAKRNVAQALTAGPRRVEGKRLANKLASLCARKEDAEHWIEGFRKAGVDFK